MVPPVGLSRVGPLAYEEIGPNGPSSGFSTMPKELYEPGCRAEVIGSPPVNRHHVVCDTDHPERGASLVEYVLLLSLIVLVCLASLTAFGEAIGSSTDDSASRVVTASGGSYG